MTDERGYPRIADRIEDMFIVDELSTNASGKVTKSALREAVARQ